MKYFSWFTKIKPLNEKFNELRIVELFGDVPENTSNDIYIVRSGGFEKWVIFMCPNKCGQRVEVNLMKSKDKRWKLKITKGKVTLSPSIVVENCNAHFWLYQNEIEWAFFAK